MLNRPAEVVHHKKTYWLELGTISNTHIGYEDHGQFTLSVELTFSGGVQGTGQYWMGSDHEHLGPWVQEIIDVVGVDRWEALPGKKIFAARLKTDDVVSRFGKIDGFVNLDTTKIVVFDEIIGALDTTE